MQPERFSDNRTGDLVPVAGGWAFVPHPLPPEIRYDTALVMALSRADAALGELSGLGRDLPNPQLLIDPAIRQEAVLSSRIEGTRTTLEELLADEVDPPRGGHTREEAQVREVRNYVAALEYGMARLQDGITLRLLREMHAILLDGVRGRFATPGAFRTRQNWVGGPGSTLATATYVPPPPQAMMQALAAWETFVQQGAACPDLIQCALQHVQFESIHPFTDGNGRMGRLLITLFLLRRRRLSQPLLYLSAFFEDRRAEYYRLLQMVHMHGMWEDWLLFFLEGVEETALLALGRARRLLDLRAAATARVAQVAPKALPLVDALIVNPYLTVSRAATVLHASVPTATGMIEKLERAGLLVEQTGRAWGRLYAAPAVLDVLHSVFDTPPSLAETARLEAMARQIDTALAVRETPPAFTLPAREGTVLYRLQCTPTFTQQLADLPPTLRTLLLESALALALQPDMVDIDPELHGRLEHAAFTLPHAKTPYQITYLIDPTARHVHLLTLGTGAQPEARHAQPRSQPQLET